MYTMFSTMVLLICYALFSAVGVVLVTLSVLYLYFKYRHTYWKKLGVPYMEPKIPYGNFEESMKITRTLGQTIANFYNEMKAKGHSFFGVYFFHNPRIVVIDPDLIKSVMARDFSHFYDRGVYHNKDTDPLSAHLFALEGKEWKNLRAKLTPTFTSGKMKKMFQTLVDTSHELKRCLNEPISKGEPVDIKKICVQYTTDVIGSCAFGIECNSFQDSDTEFIRFGKKVFNPEPWDRMKFFFAINCPNVANFFKVRVMNKDVDAFYRNLVKDTIEYREKHNITRNDFMQLLIQLKNKGIVEYDEHDAEHEKEKDLDTNFNFTFSSLSAQAFVFFVAGFETSSTNMTWTLFELAQNPTIQNKVREEIVRVLAKHGGKITYEAIMEMHYMERVIQESLRKHPPVMLLQRVVTTDYTIPDTDVVLKKGIKVFIPTLAIHQDPEYYPEPEKFDPDRFTEENKATRPDYTWLPFGDGPRVCIGLRFAVLEVKVGLTQLLLNYKFSVNPKTVDPPDLDPKSFVAAPKDTIYLDAERVIN